MTDECEQTVEAAILEVFGVRASFAPNALEGARRLPLGRGDAVLFVATDDLAMLAHVWRFACRELEQAQCRAATEQRLATLKAKTSRLIPGVEAEGSALESWSLTQAELPLLERFDGYALAEGDRIVRRERLSESDVTTTLHVLRKQTERCIQVGKGELYGRRVADVSVVVLSSTRLEPVDQELVGLQANWAHRMRVEQDNLRRLHGLRRELAEKNIALAEALETARRAVGVRSKFLAHMSHEIRTPLNGIVGIAQILSDGSLTQDQQELVEVQMQSASWLREVIDAVLDLSKLEAGSMQLEIAPFDLQSLLRSVVRGAQTLADERGLDLRLTLDPNLPGGVSGDAVRIRQALLNLLSNAVKFTETGEIHVRVALDAAGLVRFEVSDPGIGVAEDRREAIFEPFVQAEASTTRRYGGTGLGLPLVRSFAQLHGGHAWVEPRPGGGSRFAFTARLPVIEVEPAPPTKVAAPEPSGLRVLLVEDQPVNQMVVRRLLERRGHTVVVAPDGAEALARVRAGAAFDLVLMDRMMPVMDGIEATTRIRALSAAAAALPIFALTAAVTKEERAACLAAGMDGVLAKPVQLDELVDVLRLAAQARGPVSPR